LLSYLINIFVVNFVDLSMFSIHYVHLHSLYSLAFTIFTGIHYIHLHSLADENGSEEDQSVRLRYEDWLLQYDQWITDQVHALEQQVAKFRKTKKALNAKQRVVRVVTILNC